MSTSVPRQAQRALCELKNFSFSKMARRRIIWPTVWRAIWKWPMNRSGLGLMGLVWISQIFSKRNRNILVFKLKWNTQALMSTRFRWRVQSKGDSTRQSKQLPCHLTACPGPTILPSLYSTFKVLTHLMVCQIYKSKCNNLVSTFLRGILMVQWPCL